MRLPVLVSSERRIAMKKKKILSWVGTAAFLAIAFVCHSTPAASVVFLLGSFLLFPVEKWQTFLKEKLELFGALKTGGLIILLVLGIVLTQTTKPAETVAETPAVAVSVSADGEESQTEETIKPENTPEPEETSEPSPEPTPESTPTPDPTPTPTSAPEPENSESVEPVQTDYVLNTNSKKFHIPSCSSVNKMKESNKEYFTGTRDEAIARGYSPCGNCKP